MRKRLKNYQQRLALVLLVVTASPAIGADAPFMGRPTVVFEGQAAAPLRMPTDVAVAADGTVYIADGVNDRILAFDSSGKLIESITIVGGVALSNPVAVTVGADGQLWIVDNGSGRVLARRSDGSLAMTLSPQPLATASSVDITDVAIDATGKSAWVVDNDHHRLLRIDLNTKTQTQIGRYGESIGQFHYPFMLTLGVDGDAYVIESINARISLFSADGVPRRALSGYGITDGDLFRPTGVAMDSKGLLWVADATFNAIQVFHVDGRVLGSLRDADGEILRFKHCMGIAFDKDDHLYVTELNAHRVRKIEITRGPPAPQPRRANRKRRGQLVGRQARGCTICHVDWFEEYTTANESTLLPAFADDPSEPIVARSKICLSCHDGSVGDARERVWLNHGHQTNIVPPATMTVPDQLPLSQGQIKCRTCHSAHTSGQINSDFKKAVFLRMDNRDGQMCLSCHGDYAGGPQRGSHPLGPMDLDIPSDLIAAGAKVGSSARQVTCSVCHTPHGSSTDQLLVMSVQSNQLCVSCHDPMNPGMYRDGVHAGHPLFAVVDAEQKRAIERMDRHLGEDDKLVCLSCHQVHHGKGERFMMAAELSDGTLCLSCHANMQSLIRSEHDLRTNHPQEANLLGMTTVTGGPCSSCHLSHRQARTPAPHPFDQRGQCITCHQSGSCAGAKPLGALNHPGTSCLDCHNPHTDTYDHFMRDQAATVCSSCHEDQAQLVTGGHDFMLNQSAWPASSSMTQDRCLVCHRPHSTAAQQLMRVKPSSPMDALGDDACIACHANAGWHEASHLAAMHPQSGNVIAAAHGLPTIKTSASSETVGCRTCHNPHAPPSRAGSLLRVAPDANATSLCLKCHTDMGNVQFTGHGSAALTHAGLDANACLPCHAVHANPALVDTQLLFPKAKLASTTPSNATTMSGADARCTGCHQTGGSAAPPAIASHPVVPMRQVGQPDSVGFLPLFDAHGLPSAEGDITCRTCHAPHGVISPSTNDAVVAMSDSERRATRMMLKPFDAPNVCTTCHGLDALRRFLYFHDPDRRIGPLTIRSGVGNASANNGTR